MKRFPKAWIGMSEEASCGDYGIVKCGDCGKLLRRWEATMHLTKNYICEDCPEDNDANELEVEEAKLKLLWLGYGDEDLDARVEYLDPLFNAMFPTTKCGHDKVYIVPENLIDAVESLIYMFNSQMPSRLGLDSDEHTFHVPYEWIDYNPGA